MKCANCGRPVDNPALKGEHCSTLCKNESAREALKARVPSRVSKPVPQHPKDMVVKPAVSSVEKGH